MDKQIFVIKLGGSLVSDSDEVPFDFAYMANLAKVIRKFTDQGMQFVIVVGGGFMMRKLRDMAKQAGIVEDMQLHWIGTTYNNVNAEIVRAFMHDICNERIVTYEDYYNPEKLKFEPGRSVIVGGGARAGHSGDMDTLLVAEHLNIKQIISLKNIDGVYTADPKLDPSATRLEKITWDEYFKIIGFVTEHKPGGNFPVDPVASQKAKETGRIFNIVLGDDLQNFENLLEGKNFIGTVVG